MAKNKYHYYVVVCTDNQAKMVTKINNETKYAHWNVNDPPMEFSKSYAEDLAYCLNLNFTPAFVLQSYYTIESQIFYKKECNENETRNSSKI